MVLCALFPSISIGLTKSKETVENPIEMELRLGKDGTKGAFKESV